MNKLLTKYASRDARYAILLSLVLILLPIALFHPVSGYDYVNYDDDVYVFNNPHLQEGFHLKALKWAFEADLTHDSPNSDYWQPLTWISRLIDIELFGFNPGAHHLMNLLFHTLNTLLLFISLCHCEPPKPVILSRSEDTAKDLGSETLHFVQGDRGKDNWILKSFLIAALFSIHPIQVDTVAWITARKDVLATFFGFLSILCYVLFTKANGVIARPAGAKFATKLAEIRPDESRQFFGGQSTD